MGKMKRNKDRGDGTGSQQVHVEFTHPHPKGACLSGTFNDWRPETTPLIALGEGRWVKEMALAPGRYE